MYIQCTEYTTFFAALTKKECLRRHRNVSKREPGGIDAGISMPTKLTQLRYSGYSAEFLDRVEPNGNIPGKNSTAIAGKLVVLVCVYACQEKIL